MTLIYYLIFIVISMIVCSDGSSIPRSELIERNYQGCGNFTPHKDLITHLPGLSDFPDDFLMYSGYLIAKRPKKKMFYWLNTGKCGSEKKLIVYLNGGPGCSSMYGLFMGNGPFTIDEENPGKLKRNKYSWNRMAHTLYIEAPLGVGYSHHESRKNLNQSDHSTATDILHSLENFMEVHPQYREYDLYLTGGGYSGIYIPVIAANLLEHNSILAENFQGIMLGNPYLNEDIFKKAQYKFAYSRGLINSKLYESLTENDCDQYTGLPTGLPTTRHYVPDEERSLTEKICSENVRQWRSNVGKTKLDSTNANYQCWVESYDMKQDYEYLELANYTEGNYTYYYYEFSQEDYDYIRDELSKETPYVWKTYWDIDCERKTNEILEKYLSEEKVQREIHADRIESWKICNMKVNRAFRGQYEDMTHHVNKILRKFSKKVLLFYGDSDYYCSFFGGEAFIKNLGFEATTRKTFSIKRGNMNSVAGYYEKYHHGNLKYAIVRGAGHSSYKDKPQEVYTLIRNWITNRSEL